MGSKVEHKQQQQPIVIEDEDRLRIAELATMCSVPVALKVAVQMDVAEIIQRSGKGHLSAADIVAQVPGAVSPTSASYLERILRVLASRGIFEETRDADGTRRYGLTPMCTHLIKDARGVSLAHLLLLNQDDVLMPAWQFLHEAVLDGGEPFRKSHGKTAFEFVMENPRISSMANVAMSNHSRLYMAAILDAYSAFFDGAGGRTLVDVGGGVGTSLALIITRHPDIRGINFDQPHVVAAAPDIPGVEHVGGDMFESVPKGDAIFMKFILHNWSDEACMKLLKNCYESLPEDGKVIVVDSVLPSTLDTRAGARVALSADLVMLVYHGGKERTIEEFCTLAASAGFPTVKLMVTVDSISVLEFHKK